MKTLSVVIPFYNEGENVNRIYDELVDAHGRLFSSYALEIVFTDNHSGDDSFERAVQIAHADGRVKVIRLSRNFGYQASILTGLLACTGDAVVQLDADGEDDPVLIATMLEMWEAGTQVAYGIRRRRCEPWLLTFQRKIFYRLLRFGSGLDVPPDAGDFRLMDRRIIDTLRRCRESSLYLRGLVAYAGYAQAGFEYDRRPRFRGTSRFTYRGYWKMAWDGITSFSDLPLRLAAYFGALLSGGSFIALFFYLAYHFLVGTKTPGFTTIILTIFFLAGVQFLFMGILGMYVGRIYMEVKQRPLSVIETTVPDGDCRVASLP